MALTNPFDKSTPAGSDDPKAGDNRIRELKDAIVERESQDHYWPASGTVYDDDDTGFHSKVTLLVGSAPSSKADAGIVYAKDVGGKAELFYKDEDGNEVQITTAGALNSTSIFVTGDLLLSSVTTAHTGWTNVTATYANRHLRVGNTALGTGGSATLSGNTGSHTLTTAEIPAHDHSVTLLTGGAGTGNGGFSNTSVGTTGSTGGGGGHSHDLSSVSNTPLYVDVRMFKKD